VQEDVLEVLLSLGANASAADNIENTGLHVAAEFGRVSAATQPMEASCHIPYFGRWRAQSAA
jgi:ankyrin repeat protein